MSRSNEGSKTTEAEGVAAGGLGGALRRRVQVDVTEDEEAVLATIRETPYGDVVAEMRAGMLTVIRRHQTLEPPSLARRRKRGRKDAGLNN